MKIPAAINRFPSFATCQVRSFQFPVLVALVCGQIAPLAADDLLQPRIAGIRVVSFTPDPVANERDPVNRAWPFNSSFQPLMQGTHIDILIPSPPGGFVGNDFSANTDLGKVIKAVDSRGKDLTAPRIHQYNGNPWPIEPTISQLQTARDGSAAVITLFLPQTPTPGAGSIELAAEITLKHCATVREFKATGVNTRQPGASFQLGPLTMEVMEIMTIESKERPISFLYLESNAAREAVKTMELRKDGKTLHKMHARHNNRGAGKGPSTIYSCTIDGVDVVDVVASVYEGHDKPETLTIPIAVTAGLGLAAGEDGDPPLTKVGPEDPQVTVAGFEIVDPANLRLMPDTNRLYGTTVALTMVRVGGGMIKLDPAQCKIEQATDSMGKDLTTARADEREGGDIFHPRFRGSLIAQPGTTGGVEILLPQPPSPGSHSIRFRASIAMLCNDETKEIKTTAVDLTKTGAAYEAGPFRFEVTRPEATGEFDQHQPCSIKMTTRRNPNEIKHVALQVGDRTIIAEGGASGFYDGVHEANFSIRGLAKLPPSADLVVTVYKDLENPKTLMVPVEGTLGLGLPPQR